jgi:hypothetical protein
MLQFQAARKQPMTTGKAESYGQALQHLDCCLDVAVGEKVTLVVKREGPEVSFLIMQQCCPTPCLLEPCLGLWLIYLRLCVLKGGGISACGGEE